MNKRILFKEIRKIIGKLDTIQVQSINNIMLIAEQEKATNLQLAYMLSTAWHEARMRPVREGFKQTDLSARLFVRNQRYSYAQPMGKYNHWYYGRGLVQLTWWKNYKKHGKQIGVDLEQFPDKALEPQIAAKLLVLGMMHGWYNGKKKGLPHYLPPNGVPDWKNARRTVNITDKWGRFRDTAIKFHIALRKAREAPKDIKTSTPPAITLPPAVVAPVAFWSSPLFPWILGSVAVVGLGVFIWSFLRWRENKKNDAI